MFERAKQRVADRKARQEDTKQQLRTAQDASPSPKTGPINVPNSIILFHYYASPVARRVVWYLNLKGIQYAECVSYYSLSLILLRTVTGVVLQSFPFITICIHSEIKSTYLHK
jgi:hypothetical protein